MKYLRHYDDELLRVAIRAGIPHCHVVFEEDGRPVLMGVSISPMPRPPYDVFTCEYMLETYTEKGLKI